MNTYQETVDWMFQQLPMYQHVGSKAYKVDLSNILKLSSHLGHPHGKFRSIHVAGTNGKGSVSHMLASVLQESGYRVGLYTSPHLKDFRERIRINGQKIPESTVMEFIAENEGFLKHEQLSFFEMSVGMAFDHFAAEKVDIAVIEVGLGGRLDSTNIISPELSVITNIGLDHTSILGNTLEQIAREKGGIIKQGTPVVIGEYQRETYPVFQKLAQELEAPVFLADKEGGLSYSSDLKGAYQAKNLRTVLMAVSVLRNLGWKIPEKRLVKGLLRVVENTGLRGRWEILREKPRVICDTAHNREGLLYAMKQLEEEPYDNLFLVVGVVNDKDLETVLPVFPKNGRYFFCRPNVPRGMDAEILRAKAGEKHLQGAAYNSVSEAYEAALRMASSEDVIYVGGSTFTVAEII